MESSVVAIVPSKMTSVRIPRKNTADFCGFPLFYYSVRVAQQCKKVSNVYVSSEDSAVLEMASEYGAVSLRRPQELSAPHVPNLIVLEHAIDEISRLKGRSPDVLILLQPTHPLRRLEDLEDALDVFLKDGQADSLVSVVPSNELRGRVETERFIPEVKLPRDKSSEVPLYRNTGSFYILNIERTIKAGSLLGSQILPYQLARPKFEIDIDEPEDLVVARSLYETYKSEFCY